MKPKIVYGGIYWVSFAPSVGHEYQGNRPAVVIQADKQLKQTNLATIMPLTSQTGKAHQDDVLVRASKMNNLFTDSVVKVHHIESFDRKRFLKYIGFADTKALLAIKKYLKLHFQI